MRYERRKGEWKYEEGSRGKEEENKVKDRASIDEEKRGVERREEIRKKGERRFDEESRTKQKRGEQ